ncbi:hypothetical protein [Actinomadura violacea]|uniref:hypothetical protein n=1 Tax=Actinomadura violacea TaxID=2819934 RepID=UPI003557EDC8
MRFEHNVLARLAEWHQAGVWDRLHRRLLENCMPLAGFKHHVLTDGHGPRSPWR